MRSPEQERLIDRKASHNAIFISLIWPVLGSILMMALIWGMLLLFIVVPISLMEAGYAWYIAYFPWIIFFGGAMLIGGISDYKSIKKEEIERLKKEIW